MRSLWGTIFNKTIVPLALVGHEMIIAKCYQPFQIQRALVEYWSLLKSRSQRQSYAVAVLRPLISYFEITWFKLVWCNVNFRNCPFQLCIHSVLVPKTSKGLFPAVFPPDAINWALTNHSSCTISLGRRSMEIHQRSTKQSMLCYVFPPFCHNCINCCNFGKKIISTVFFHFIPL